MWHRGLRERHDGESAECVSHQVLRGHGRRFRADHSGNGTFSESTTLVPSTTCTVLLTNSLIVAVSDTNRYSGVYNATSSTTNGLFQAVGRGYHYLASGSAHRDAGTSLVNSQLLTDLRSRTTWPKT
jgi:hypothetical protein